MDKLIFSVVILTLYLSIRDDFTSKNVVNMGASLFMWCTRNECMTQFEPFLWMAQTRIVHNGDMAVKDLSLSYGYQQQPLMHRTGHDTEF
jgi:hypothetical protein